MPKLDDIALAMRAILTAAKGLFEKWFLPLHTGEDSREVGTSHFVSLNGADSSESKSINQEVPGVMSVKPFASESSTGEGPDANRD
ncbi:MAG: hypothetical protein K1X53_05030 [Candidatus Sumerlaeaceae bacterium]|nr:hypothetical protein [Candidatus Sumerlaeaceae bacterium]